VDLSDGRSIITPLAWFPRLLYATQEERNSWRLIGEKLSARQNKSFNLLKSPSQIKVNSPISSTFIED